jgi:hypothetical protein
MRKRKQKLGRNEKLRRRAASDYLLETHGIKYAPSTLAKFACWGVGPPFHYLNDFYPVYTPAELDRWVKSLQYRPISPARTHTQAPKTGPKLTYRERVARMRQRDTLRDDLARSAYKPEANGSQQETIELQAINQQPETRDLQTSNQQQSPHRLEAKRTTARKLEATNKQQEAENAKTRGSTRAAEAPSGAAFVDISNAAVAGIPAQDAP